MAQNLKNPPVYYTLAQVQFNPVLTLDNHLPSIQEGMRKLGYPDFQVFETQIFKMGEDAKAPAQSETEKQYLFHNIEKTFGFALNKNSMVLQSTVYDGYQDFSRKLFSGLKLVDDHLGLDYVDRLGMRFLNEIRPDDGKDIGNFLIPQSLGLSNLLGGSIYHNYVEHFGRVDDIDVRTRVLAQIGVVGFPPDIVPQGLKVQKRFQREVGLHAMLDIDGFCSERQAFKLEKLESEFARIHEKIEVVFLSIVSETAKKRWDE